MLSSLGSRGGAGQDGALSAGLALVLDLGNGLFDAGIASLLPTDLGAEGGAAQPAGQVGAGDDEGLADLEAADSMHDLDGLAALQAEEVFDGSAGEEGNGGEFRPR